MLIIFIAIALCPHILHSMEEHDRNAQSSSIMIKQSSDKTSPAHSPLEPSALTNKIKQQQFEINHTVDTITNQATKWLYDAQVDSDSELGDPEIRYYIEDIWKENYKQIIEKIIKDPKTNIEDTQIALELVSHTAQLAIFLNKISNWHSQKKTIK